MKLTVLWVRVMRGLVASLKQKQEFGRFGFVDLRFQ